MLGLRIASVGVVALLGLSGCAAPSNPATTPAPTTRVSDATGRISFEVPEGWADLNGTPQNYGDGSGSWRLITTAPVVTDFNHIADVGASVMANFAHPGESPDAVLGDLKDWPTRYCAATDPATAYASGDYTGTITWFHDCASNDSARAAEFAGSTTDGTAIVQVNAVYLASDGDATQRFQQLVDSVRLQPADDPIPSDPDYPADWLPVRADCGCLSARVPPAWRDVSFGLTSASADSAKRGWIQASPDLAAWGSDVTTPGLAVYIFPDAQGRAIDDPLLLGPDYDKRYRDACTAGDSGPIDLGSDVTASYRVFTDCGRSGGLSDYLLTATNADGSGAVLVSVRAAADEIDAIATDVFDSLDSQL